MSEHVQGRSMREIKQIVARDQARYDRLTEAWDGLTEEQQEQLVSDAEAIVSENEMEDEA
jgi:hypothetical protein